MWICWEGSGGVLRRRERGGNDALMGMAFGLGWLGDV